MPALNKFVTALLHMIMALCAGSVMATAFAGVPKDLPYPEGGQLTAQQVAEQVYFVNHFYAYRNFSVQKDGGKTAVGVIRTQGEPPKTMSISRYINNDYDDGVVKARDMVFFHSGKMRGTGILVTDYVDDAKSQLYVIWLPALRKVRRFGEPAHDENWGGSDITFGDIALRKPHHEEHELLAAEVFSECLTVMEIPPEQRTKYLKEAPPPDCIKDRPVYKLKSTTRFKDWWYDYRISYVDTETFADYRTEYFKAGNKIKFIDRSWGKIEGMKDKRALTWRYWYGTTLASGHETMAFVPDGAVQYNSDIKGSFWSEKTLRRIKR